MRWNVILASLKHSHSVSLGFASYYPRSKAAFSSLQSRVLENPRSSPFTQTLGSSSHLPKGSASRITVRAATTIATSGKVFSLSQAETDKITKIRLSGAASSTQSNTTFTGSPSKRFAKKDTSSALPAAQGNFKAAHAEVENPHIASLRTRGNRDSISSKHAEEDDYRSSLAQLVSAKTADRNKKIVEDSSIDRKISGGFGNFGAGIVSPRMSKVTTSFEEGKAKHKSRSYESLLDASASSKGQVLSREVSSCVTSKAGNGIKRPVDSEGLSEDITAFASSDSLESRLDDGFSEAEVAPRGGDKGGNKVGDEPKKPFLQISHPITVFVEWWIYCFLRGYRPYPEMTYHLDRLYVWLGAYQRVHLDATGNHVDSHSAALLSKNLENLKFAVTKKVFRWGDTENIYLRSPQGSAKESSSSFSDVDESFIFQDRVVQEVLYLILEPMFEARFSTRSHASRPCRGAHTALRAARRSFLGCTWFISGDLSVLQESEYATQLVDSACKVIKDARVSVLLQRGFLGGKFGKVNPMRSSFLSATQGSCGRLNHLLHNVLLDPLDWWMEEQISNFSKRERPPSDETSENLLCMPMRISLKQPGKLEYVRHGTKFWVGCSGTEEEVDSIQKDIFTFLEQKFGTSLLCNLAISHITDGVNILDHVISQKVVRPIYMRRKASSGRMFEKRAFRIRLRIKASLDCCSKYLKEVGMPASLQHIDEALSVLDYWYCYAENKVKVLEYCKLILCYAYSKGTCEEDSTAVEQFKKAMETVGCLTIKHGHLGGGKDFIRIPEHEKVLRDHAWLQSRALTTQFKESFKSMSKTSPQQNMSQVLWRFLKAEKADDGGWSLDAQMQTSSLDEGSEVNVKLEELAESAG